MWLPLKRFLRWFGYLLVASVAMYLATHFVLSSDQSRPAIERFLASNEKIITQLGEIKEIELVKKVSVSATDSSSPYRLYTFVVSGTKAKATVLVRVERPKSNSGPEQFLIDAIDLQPA